MTYFLLGDAMGCLVSGAAVLSEMNNVIKRWSFELGSLLKGKRVDDSTAKHHIAERNTMTRYL